MTTQQIHILHHSLGLTRGREIYRNHFVTGEGSKDYENCMALVETGHMTRRDGSALTGGDYLFLVTEAGKAEALAALPPGQKLTRAQKRYRSYLNADTGEKFGDYLKRMSRKCTWCKGGPVITHLDGDNLCRQCANVWMNSERQAYFESEAEAAAHV